MIRINCPDKRYVIHVYESYDDIYIVKDDDDNDSTESQFFINPNINEIDDDYITEFTRKSFLGIFNWSLEDGLSPLTQIEDIFDVHNINTEPIICVTGVRKIIKIEIPYPALTKFSKFVEYDYTALGYLKYLCIKDYCLFVPYHWMIDQVDMNYDCIATCDTYYMSAFKINVFKGSTSTSYLDMWYYDSTKTPTCITGVYEMIRDQVFKKNSIPQKQQLNVATDIMCAGIKQNTAIIKLSDVCITCRDCE